MPSIYTADDVRDEFRDDETSEYGRRRESGGYHSREGLDYETVVALRYLLYVVVRELRSRRDGAEVHFTRGPYGFVDDIEIIFRDGVHRFECKTGRNVSWGEVTGKGVAGNFRLEATMLTRAKRKFRLHLVMADAERALVLSDTLPEKILANVSAAEHTRFHEMLDPLSSIDSNLRTICSADCGESRRFAAKVMLGAIHTQLLPGTLAEIMDEASGMSNGLLYGLQRSPPFFVQCMALLDGVPGIVSDKKRFILSCRGNIVRLDFPIVEVSMFAPFLLNDPRFLVFMQALITGRPNTEIDIMTIAKSIP